MFDARRHAAPLPSGMSEPPPDRGVTPMSRVSSVRTPRWSVRHRERGLAGGSLLLLLFLYAPVFASGFAGRPHFWVWSELHINYAAGFVRRGLLGEIAYRVQGLTGLS